MKDYSSEPKNYVSDGPVTIMEGELRRYSTLIQDQKEISYVLLSLVMKLHRDEEFYKQATQVCDINSITPQNKEKTPLLLELSINNSNLEGNNELLRLIRNKLTELI